MILRLLLLAITLAAGSAAAQAPLTKEQGDAILLELRAIRQALERAPAAPAPAPAAAAPSGPVRFDLKGAHVMGRPDAPITVVEFTDYECPFCKRHRTQTWPELKKNFVDTGKVRYVVADLPLSFHPRAQKAGEAAHCAGEQGRFWELQDKMIVAQPALAPEQLVGYAKDLGMDEARFKACLDSGRHAERVKTSGNQANAIGITGTPTFLIGKTEPNRIEGQRFVGAQPYPAFENRLNEALKTGK